MFVLKILTTVWLALTAFGTSSTMLDEKETVSSRLLGAAVINNSMAGINRIWNVKYHVRRKRDS
nr:MAG TPA: hypothetical protein [Bacteriophage sp.]